MLWILAAFIGLFSFNQDLFGTNSTTYSLAGVVGGGSTAIAIISAGPKHRYFVKTGGRIGHYSVLTINSKFVEIFEKRSGRKLRVVPNSFAAPSMETPKQRNPSIREGAGAQTNSAFDDLTLASSAEELFELGVIDEQIFNKYQELEFSDDVHIVENEEDFDYSLVVDQ